MSEKFIIGLTGNIATGKSVVMKMLENLGSYTIDADELVHSAMVKGGPAYKKVVSVFGSEILGENDEIDRKVLGEIVFQDSEKLERLESILHPLVRRAVQYLVSRSKSNVIVIEAIKLLESPLKEQCNSIWVVTSEIDQQINRLAVNRGMSEEEARMRLANQSPESEKIKHANVIIQNDTTLVDTWKQVLAAWIVTVINRKIDVKEHPRLTLASDKKDLQIVHAKPKHAGYIAGFLNRDRTEEEFLVNLDILERFGDRAYYLLMDDDEIVGLIGWQVEDLVAQVDEIEIYREEDQNPGIRLLITELEKTSKSLSTEVVIIKSTKELASKTVWNDLGYQIIETNDISVKIWKKAAEKLAVGDSVLLIKEVRSDRVLLPL